MSVNVDALAKAIAEAAEEYEKQYGHLPSKAKVTLSKADSISKAQEAREDLEIITKVVRQYHPGLSEAQVVTKALEAYPELYDRMVS